MAAPNLSRRAFFKKSTADSWNLLWEAGPYYERVAEVLAQANSYAVFAGWQIDSRIELTTKRAESFRELVIRLCLENPDLHVYFLMWDYAYFFMFEREALQGWVWEGIHKRVHFVFDNRHPYGGSHHEKLVVVDGEIAFVGGVDICGDRWDSPEHLYTDARRSFCHDGEAHLPYHDLIVEVRGEVAAEIAGHIGLRWQELSSVSFPPLCWSAGVKRLNRAAGSYPVLISRTRASVGTRRPLLVRETEFLLRELIRQAQTQLVIENQYLWSRKIKDELLAVMRARRGTGFRLFLVLPSAEGGSFAFRMMGVLQTRLLDEIHQVALDTGTRLVFGCPFTRARGQNAERRIYVHSKVLIIDDRYLAIGSSNFNNRGFRLDSELTLTLVGETPELRADIRGQTGKIVGHWGAEAVAAFEGKVPVTPAESCAVYLKSYHATWDEYFRTTEGRCARLLPLQRIFDPQIPLGFLLRSRLAIGNLTRIRRALPIVIWGLLLLAPGLSLLLLRGLVEFAPAVLLPAITYALFLSMSWALPVPTLLASLCAGAQLGAVAGGALVFCSLLVSASLGYLLSRIFPNMVRMFLQKSSAGRISNALGARRLPVVMKIACDPRLSFQSKIVYQGVYSIPLRWFGPAVLVLTLVNCIFAVLGALLGIRGEPTLLLAGFVAVATIESLRRHYK